MAELRELEDYVIDATAEAGAQCLSDECLWALISMTAGALVSPDAESIAAFRQDRGAGYGKS